MNPPGGGIVSIRAVLMHGMSEKAKVFYETCGILPVSA